MYQKMINRKTSKKGFTLVEIIVVLVILAILAAIMIPSMVGWIDKAREKQVWVEARTYLLAAQTLASEDYGRNTSVSFTVPVGTTADTAQDDTIYGLSGIGASADSVPSACTATNGTVTALTVMGTNITLTYASGTWTES